MSEPTQEPIGPHPNSLDAVVAAYKRDVDRTLLHETLVLTPDQRIRRLADSLRVVAELRRAMRDAT